MEDRTEKEKQLEERIRKLEAENAQLSKLLEISIAFQSEMDVDRLFPTIIPYASQSVGADRCSVFAYNKQKGILWTRVAQGTGLIVIPKNKGVAGWVLEHREPLIIADAYSDPRFDPSTDQRTGYRTKTLAAIPLLNRYGEPIGVFEAVNKLDGGVFTKNDLKILKAVAAQISIALENAMLYTQLRETFESFVDVMAFSIDAKHPVARGHSRRVAIYAKGIAEYMRLSPKTVTKIYLAGLLHDYGKISIPDAILHKAGALTREEYEQMKRHAIMTYRILSRIKFSADMVDIPLIASEHHERWDGKGYPFGKSHDQIPMGAQILAVADVFDAITSFREYHTPKGFREAKEEIVSLRGKAFDPRVVDAFVRYFDEELDPKKIHQILKGSEKKQKE